MQVFEARDGGRPTYEHVLQERREVVWLVDYYGLEWVNERIGGTARTVALLGQLRQFAGAQPYFSAPVDSTPAVLPNRAKVILIKEVCQKRFTHRITELTMKVSNNFDLEYLEHLVSESPTYPAIARVIISLPPWVIHSG